jgi:hypothetical protein
MKVDIEKIRLAKSGMTDKVFAGVMSAKPNVWAHKVDVTNDFISCVIQRWENQVEVISAGKDKWEISVKKL